MKPYSAQEARKRRRLFRKKLREEDDSSYHDNSVKDVPSKLSAGAVALIIIVIAGIFFIAIRTNFGVPRKQEGCFVINRNGEKEYRPCH